jgi:hypothetical protein
MVMLRAFSMFGLGGIFLAISPKLRGQVWDAIGGGVGRDSLQTCAVPSTGRRRLDMNCE